MYVQFEILSGGSKCKKHIDRLDVWLLLPSYPLRSFSHCWFGQPWVWLRQWPKPWWCSHQGSRPIGVSCTSESSQLVFVQGSAIPNRHPTPSLSSQYLTDREGKMPEAPINVPMSSPQNTPNSQRPSKCLKATQTLKFEFDKKIRLLLI